MKKLSLSAAIAACLFSVAAPTIAQNSQGDIRRWQSSCADGNPVTCYFLGGAYEDGNGVTQDLVRAARLHRQSCDGDIFEACSSLGDLYLRGRGVEQNFNLAASLFRKACDGGGILACHRLGDRYANGEGVELDVVRAKNLYKKACDLGYATSCSSLISLGTSDEEGLQAYVDAKAEQRACKRGNTLACDGVLVAWARAAESQEIVRRAISDDGQLVAIGTERGNIVVYDGYSGDLVFAAEGNIGEPRILKFSPSGRFLYAKTRLRNDPSKALDKVWDLVQRKNVLKYNTLQNFQFSPDEKYVGGINRNGRFQTSVFKTNRNGKSYVLHSVYRGGARGPWSFSPDSRSVVFRTATNGFLTLGLANNSILHRFQDRNCCSSIQYSPDGRTIVTSKIFGGGRSLTFWNAQSGGKIRTVDFEGGEQFAFSSDGSKLLVFSDSGNGGPAKIYSASSGQLLLAVERHPSGFALTNPERFIWNDRYLVGQGAGAGVGEEIGGIWDAQTGAFLSERAGLGRIFISNDGTRFVAAPVDGKGIVIGDTISTLGLDRQLSPAERDRARRNAQRRTNAILAERQAEIDERARGQALVERTERQTGGGNQSILGAILRGASNSLNDYNRQQRSIRQSIERRESFGRGATSTSSRENNRDQGRATASGSSGSSSGQSSFVRVIPDNPPASSGGNCDWDGYLASIGGSYGAAVPETCPAGFEK